MPGAEESDRGYWRDMRTLDSYFDAHMDLCAVQPTFNLYNERWPILTNVPIQPPAKFMHYDGDRTGQAVDSVISNGVIVSGGLVRGVGDVAGGAGRGTGPGWNVRCCFITCGSGRARW